MEDVLAYQKKGTSSAEDVRDKYEIWHETKDDTTDYPDFGSLCLLRVTFMEDDGDLKIEYPTAIWGKYGWTEDYLDRLKNFDNFEITHWKQIKKMED